jgi:tetratricopeptide (TPR) repeat protein
MLTTIPSRLFLSTVLATTLLGLGITATTNSFAQRTPEPKPKAEAAAPKEGLRPVVATPLQAVQQMIQMKQFKEALSKIAEVDLIANRTPYELFVIERMRGTAAAAVGEHAIAAKSFESVMDTGRLSPEERTLFSETIMASHYNLKDYKLAAVWAERTLKEGSTKLQTRMILIQSLFLADDMPNAKKETDAIIADEQKAGRIPTEDMFKMLGRIAQKQKDPAGYLVALENLVTYYPTKNYWADWVARVTISANMTDRYMQDVFRLQMALGENLTAPQYVFLARNTLSQGFPIDAKQILDHGFAAGVLGTEAEHKTLRDRLNKEAADDIKNMLRTSTEAANGKEGPGLFNSGLNFVISGDKQKGIALMEEGIKRPGIKRPDDAKLRLGVAYATTGNREKAVSTLASLTGPDGLTEVAKLWTAFAKQQKSAP